MVRSFLDSEMPRSLPSPFTRELPPPRGHRHRATSLPCLCGARDPVLEADHGGASQMSGVGRGRLMGRGDQWHREIRILMLEAFDNLISPLKSTCLRAPESGPKPAAPAFSPHPRGYMVTAALMLKYTKLNT